MAQEMIVSLPWLQRSEPTAEEPGTEQMRRAQIIVVPTDCTAAPSPLIWDKAFEPSPGGLCDAAEKHVCLCLSRC